MASTETLVVSSRSRTKLLRLKRRRKQYWPEPELSLGSCIDKHSTVKSWALAGPALKAWEELQPAIDNCLRRSDILQSVGWVCYMCGKKPEKARPTIIFWCADRESRRRAQQLIIEDGMLDKQAYRGFQTCTMARAPGYDDLVDFTDREDAKLHTKWSANFSLCKDIVADRYFLFKDEHERRSCGELSGPIWIEGQPFHLTSAHLLTGMPSCYLQSETDDDRSSFEALFDSDSDDEDLVFATSRGSRSSFSSITDSSASASSRRDESEHTASSNSTDVDIEPRPLLISDNVPETQASPERDQSDYEVIYRAPYVQTLLGQSHLDYALVNCPPVVSDHQHGLLANYRCFSDSTTRPVALNQSVTIETARRGTLHGTLLSASVASPNTIVGHVLGLWLFVPDESSSLEHCNNAVPGDSGAFVFDHDNKQIYGHVVAGSVRAGTALIMPLHRVFEDIRTRFGAPAFSIANESENCMGEQQLPDPGTVHDWQRADSGSKLSDPLHGEVHRHPTLEMLSSLEDRPQQTIKQEASLKQTWVKDELSRHSSPVDHATVSYAPSKKTAADGSLWYTRAYPTPALTLSSADSQQESSESAGSQRGQHSSALSGTSPRLLPEIYLNAPTSATRVDAGMCPIPSCGRRFKDLKRHMLTHQYDRPEKCPILSCEYHVKGFARKYDKNRHTLTHYKGTLVCGFCPGTGTSKEKSFNRADVFKRHLTSVHGVEQTLSNTKRRKAVLSKKSTGSAGQIHEQKASGTCSTCGKQFPDAQAFYEHLDDCVMQVVHSALDEKDNCVAVEAVKESPAKRELDIDARATSDIKPKGEQGSSGDEEEKAQDETQMARPKRRRVGERAGHRKTVPPMAREQTGVTIFDPSTDNHSSFSPQTYKTSKAETDDWSMYSSTAPAPASMMQMQHVLGLLDGQVATKQDQQMQLLLDPLRSQADLVFNSDCSCLPGFCTCR